MMGLWDCRVSQIWTSVLLLLVLFFFAGRD
jgi:hypothetical protein